MENNIVYVLTNPAMPGLTKIGMTNKAEVEKRMKELFTTGVPVPFDCVFACQVADAIKVEKALHFAFGDKRINPNREFFKIEPERVVAILKLLEIKDITVEIELQVESDSDAIDKQSATALKKSRRPRLDFLELGIPSDSILIFNKDSEQTARVVDSKKVEFGGEVCSLTMATRKVLGLSDDYPIGPAPYWSFKGKTILEIYDTYHGSNDE